MLHDSVSFTENKMDKFNKLTGESMDILKIRTLSGFISLNTIMILRRYLRPSATCNKICLGSLDFQSQQSCCSRQVYFEHVENWCRQLTFYTTVEKRLIHFRQNKISYKL